MPPLNAPAGWTTMKRVITSALALVLLAGTAEGALAQDGGYNPAMRRSWRNNPDNAATTQTQMAPPQRAGDQDNEQRARSHDNDRRGRDGGGERRTERNDDRRPDWPDRDRRDRDGLNRNDRDRYDRRDWDRRGENWDRWNRNRSGWDRDRDGWERSRPRYDPYRYPRTWRAPQRYRGFVYQAPPGFYARSWAFGEILPRGWYEPEYRILDWWAYGLPIPPIGYDWVRVGNDVLLVDSFSGRIVQVVRNLFW